jgi:hypothetical protein
MPLFFFFQIVPEIERHPIEIATQFIGRLSVLVRTADLEIKSQFHFPSPTMDVEDSMEYFFDRKKCRQNEIRIEKANKIRETKQAALEAKLQSLNESKK